VLPPLLFAGLVLLVTPLAQASESSVADLFDSPSASTLDNMAEPQWEGDFVTRSRFTGINQSLVDAIVGATAVPPEVANDVPSVLTVDLFPDVGLVAVLDRVENVGHGTAWLGTLKGDAGGEVILAVEDGIVQGSIQKDDQLFQIRYISGEGADAIYAIRQVDQSKFPPEDCEHLEDGDGMHLDSVLMEGQDSGYQDLSAGDSASTLDVMVVYTPGARSAAGGTSAMNALINLAVTETNQSYANSGISPRIRLVRSQEVSYTSSGSFATM
jgi:hypothetical protein